MNYHAKDIITNQGININDPYYTTVVIVLHNGAILEDGEISFTATKCQTSHSRGYVVKYKSFDELLNDMEKDSISMRRKIEDIKNSYRRLLDLLIKTE